MIKSDQIVHIQNKISSTTPIIVEGKKDKKALESIGFKNIITISGKPNGKIVQILKKKKICTIAILTDFDREGKEKCGDLTELFQRSGIKIDSFVRKTFKGTLSIHKIEEINSFTKLMEDDYYGKTCSIYDKILNRGRILNRRYSRKARHNRRDIRPDRRPPGD